MSGAGLPCILRATAGFVYVRFHGPDQHEGGSNDDASMRWWADRIAERRGPLQPPHRRPDRFGTLPSHLGPRGQCACSIW